MDYPGNNSLGSDVRDRVLGTYRQTLDLAAQGNRQEASLGCDFILRLDPEFEPARTLLARLEEGEGAVMVDDLRPGAPGFSSGADPDLGEDPLGSLDDLNLDLPGGEGASDTPSGSPPGPGGLAEELQGLLETRQFQQAVQRAEEESEAVAADPHLAQLAQAARSRQEAEPYIRSFLESARTALDEGNREKAERLLESAEELDPNHPGIDELRQAVHSGGDPSDAPAAAATDLPDLDLGESLDTGGLGDEELDGLDLAGADGGDEEGDERIRDLLQEGQEAFDQKDFQGAIDAWSRIFLIDIDHQEAAQRIEQARRLKAEHERQVEEIFHDGVSRFEAGDGAGAKEKFQQVLKLQPGHLAAKEHLHKIDSGEMLTGAPASPAGGPTPVPSLPEDAEDPVFQEEILVPPEPGGEAPAAPPEPAPSSASSTGSGLPVSRNFLIIGGAVLLLVVLGGWFVLQQWDNFFPNAAETTATGGGGDPIAAATQLRLMGNTELAISRLQQVGPGEPHYEDAQSLIAQWQAEASDEGAEGDEGDGQGPADSNEALPEAVDTQRAELIAAAYQATSERRYLDAEALLEEAAQIAELDGRESALSLEVQEALEPIRSQVELVRGGDWDYVLPDLWRMREEDRSYPDVNRLLVTSYYNLGVRDLQRGDPEAAEAQFQEALGLDPGDAEVERLLRFARAYRNRGKDLQYQIYVKYLPFRTL